MTRVLKRARRVELVAGLALFLTASAAFPAQLERVALCEDAGSSGSAECDGADIRIQDTISPARQFGFAVVMGHLDGDSFSDVVIGSPSAARVHVFYGGIGTGPTVRSPDDADLVLLSTDAQSGLGFSLAIAATDLNNPLLIGAPGRDDPSSPGRAFRVPASFFASRPTGTIDIATVADLTLNGEQSGNEAGYSVAIGPVLAAGSEDLVVGARLALGERGKVYAVSAAAAGDVNLADVREVTGATARNDANGTPGDGLGEVLAIADFFGDDGIHDLVIGAVGTVPSEGSNISGRVYVIRDLVGQDINLGIATNKFRTILGDAGNDFFGFSLASGDFDGDGLADLVVGAIYADRVRPTCATSEVNAGAFYFFENGSLRWSTAGQKPPPPSTRTASDADRGFWGYRRWDALGFGLAAGDVDADGDTDLIASALLHDRDQTLFDEVDEGAVYVFHGGPASIFGPSSTAAVCLDCPTDSCIENPPDADAMIFGSDYDLATATSDEAGFSLAAGDFDGDSFADLVISTIAHDRVYLVRLVSTDAPVSNPFERDGSRPHGRRTGPRPRAPVSIDGEGGP